MQFIDPAEYDHAESEAKKHMPNRVIEAYRPEAFLQKGYPAHINHPSELVRYIDAMCENSNHVEHVVNNWLGGLTEEEFWLLKSVCDAALEISEETSDRRVIPSLSALSALICLRYIRAIFPEPNHVIHELGPGSGYLGAMLSLLGYTYISMDVTQAFYVFQSRLFSRISGDRFIELASDSRPLTDWQRPEPGANIHIPWWKYVPYKPEDLNLDVDCIFVAGAIAEMHINATKYLANQACRWLGTTSNEKAFIIMGPGDDSINPMVNVMAEINRAGLKAVYEDKGGFDGEMNDRNIVHFLQPKQPDHPLPNVSPDVRPERIDRLLSLIRFNRSNRAPLGAEENKVQHEFYSRMETARANQQKKRVIGLEEVLKYYQKMSDRGTEATGDFNFIGFCNR